MASMLKNFSIALVLLATTAGAAAANAEQGERDGRSFKHREDARSTRPDPSEFRRFNESQPMDSSGGEGAKRHGRMSPEERRALRKQIHDANQDLSYPRR